MAQNIDPVGPVPKADANNRLVLIADSSTKANALFAAVASSIVAVLTISFFYMRFMRGLPPRWDDKGIVYIALAGVLFIPLAIYWILTVLFPARLEIDDEGLVYQARGRTTKILWAALNKISLRQVIIAKGSNTQTNTRIEGNGQNISFMPIFGVWPVDLTRYISARQKSSGAGSPVIVEGDAALMSAAPQSSASSNEIRSAVLGTSGGILAVVLVAILIVAVVFAVFVYQAMRH